MVHTIDIKENGQWKLYKAVLFFHSFSFYVYKCIYIRRSNV